MKNVLNNSKFLNIIVIWVGILIFKLTGKSPKLTQKALINIYCLTNGRYNVKLNLILSKKNKTLTKIPYDSLFKTDYKNIDLINRELNENGYYILEDKLSKKYLDGILEIIGSCYCKGVNGDKMIYEENKISSEIYRFDYNDVLNNKYVQDLVVDPFFYDLCCKYFKSIPFFDFSAMWISNNFLKEESEEAAQMYHFDLERTNWLKIFIYLEDVNKLNGPHNYIRGSHQVNSKPNEILKKGYVRIKDHELKKFYSKNDFKSIEGDKGTIIIGDTRCWHKGGRITNGDRKLLQLQFSSNLFGINLPKFNINEPSKKFIQTKQLKKDFLKNVNLQ